MRGARRQASGRQSCFPQGSRAPSSEPTVSLPELRSLLASGRARLFDVRSREEAAAGTIPGALNIPGTGLRRGGGEALVVDCRQFRRVLSNRTSFRMMWEGTGYRGPVFLWLAPPKLPLRRVDGRRILAAELALPV